MENGELGNGELETGGSRPVATETGGSRPVATETGESPLATDTDATGRVLPCGLATVTVSAAGKISGKFSENGTNWTVSAASFDGMRRDGVIAPYQAAESGTRDACPYQEFICSNVVAKYSYKETETVKGKKKTVTKTLTRTFTLTVSPVPVVPDVPDVADVPIRGYVKLTETGGSRPVATEIEAWQNLWGSTYKAVGKSLFSTKSGKKTLAYKMFVYELYTNGTGRIYFKDGDGNVRDADGGRIGEAVLPDLAYFSALSLKIATAGAVTATMVYDTGKTKKVGKKTVAVYCTSTCSTVVIPTCVPDTDTFTGEIGLYFASNAAAGFEGCAGMVVF